MRRKLILAGLMLGSLVGSAMPAHTHHPYSVHDDYYVSTQFHPNNDKDTTTPLTTVDIWYDSNRPINSTWVSPLLNALDEIESYASTTNALWAAHNLEFRIRGNIAVTSNWYFDTWDCQHQPSSFLKRSIILGRVSLDGNAIATTRECVGSAGWIWDAYIAIDDNDSFYYTGNGTPPVGKLDMTALLLHEVTHGIGFLGKEHSEVLDVFTGEKVGAVGGHFQERPAICSSEPFNQVSILGYHGGSSSTSCIHEENADAGACAIDPLLVAEYRTMCGGQPVGLTTEDAYIQDIQVNMRSYHTHDRTAIRAGYKKHWPLV